MPLRKSDWLAGAMLCALYGCAVFSPAYVPQPQPLESGRLPQPNVAVAVPQLGPCTDSPDRTLRFDASQPVTVLVHGCKGSAGHFRSLAQLYAFHGQQAVCFTYDDRDSLLVSSAQLIGALDALAGHVGERSITVMGHSMGGLVARKAMEQDRRGEWRRQDANIQLATVSAPFAGIDVASACGSKPVQWLSLGIVPGLCWIVTGDNWFEITAPSDFIRHPKALSSAVRRYLKIVTDERGTCRVDANGACRESDYVFSIAEQYHPVIDTYPRMTNVEVGAGHVEIVGYQHVAPRKLLEILQREGMLAPTPPERRAALDRLLAELY